MGCKYIYGEDAKKVNNIAAAKEARIPMYNSVEDILYDKDIIKEIKSTT